MALNKGTRTENAGRNVLSAFLNKMIILLLTFISRKFFIDYIGVAYLGISGLFSNILTLLSMAELGLETAINVSLYKPIAENDTEKIAALVQYFKKLYYMIALAVTVVGFAFLPFLRFVVNLDQDIPLLKVYYIVFVLKNTLSYLVAYKTSIVHADQRHYIINRLDAGVNIVRIILQTAVVILFRNYLAFIIIDAVSTLARNICVSLYADRTYPFINRKSSLPKEERALVFSDISSAFLYKVASTLLSGTDNILISILVGTIYVGYYSNYSTITHNLTSIIALLFTSLTAGIGNLIATSSGEKRYKVFQTMQTVSFWLCGIVTVCLLFLTQDFIKIWLGKAYLLDNLTLIAIVINVFFSICMRPVWAFREGTGMYRQIRYIMFVTAFLNIVLSIVLGKWLGVAGIIFATSISKLSTYFWYEPNILFKKFFKMSPKGYYLDYLKNLLLNLGLIVVCYFPKHYLKWRGIFGWIGKALILLIIINAAYFLFYRRSEAFLVLKEKAGSLLHRRK